MGDIVALQNDVADAVAGQIQVRLIPEEQARRASILAANPDAHYAYIKGRFFWNKRTLEAMDTALKYFEQAIAADPNYAPGYSGLSDCYQLLAAFGRLKPNEAYPLARAAALKALALDDRLAEAHTSLASIEGDFDWDWFRAEAEYRRYRALPELRDGTPLVCGFSCRMRPARRSDRRGSRRLWRPTRCRPSLRLPSARCTAAPASSIGLLPNIERFWKCIPCFRRRTRCSPKLMPTGVCTRRRSPKQRWEIRNGAASACYLGLWIGDVWTQDRSAAFNPRDQERSDARRLDYNLAVVYTALGDNDRAFEGLEGAFRGHDYLLTLVQADFRLANIGPIRGFRICCGA